MSTVIVTLIVICCVLGIVATRIAKRLKWQRQVKNRISQVLDNGESTADLNLIKDNKNKGPASEMTLWMPQFYKTLLVVTDLESIGNDLYQSTVIGALVVALTGMLFDLAWYFCLLAALAVLIGPVIYLQIRAASLRQRFQQQLPDAIDLMVSVLRSGHSVPQAVKSVASDSAVPLGHEFAHVEQRMNLGLSLSEALTFSQEKFPLTELELIRRAVSIQTEVGGSLAELLEKTNGTLRQRLKLKRQIKVLTTQSRLTGFIVALLPLILGLALELLSPGYMEPLFQTDLGKMLLVLAAGLQVLGVFLMKKMTEVKA